MARTNRLSAEKSGQLRKALALAEADGELVGSDIRMVPTAHPRTRDFGFILDRVDSHVGEADLLIVQHDETNIVQFVFPVQSAQPIFLSGIENAGHNFGFIRSRQLAAGVADPEKWKVVGALKIAQRLATEVILKIARAVEKAHKTEGFIAMTGGYQQPATPAQLQQAQGKRVLLFVHGIFSSIHGGFSDLGAPDLGTTAMGKLVHAYRGNVFGYDHWTISKTPSQNALDLLDKIPEAADWSVDLVCHSRGGLVSRVLFANPAPSDNLATPDLLDVVGKRSGKISSVGKVVFVAAANQGSPLADPDDLRNFLNVAAFLASRSPCFALDVVIGLARALVAAAFDLPSVRQLATGSDLITDLDNIASIMTDATIYGARADFDHAKSVTLQAAVLLDKILMRVDNDLVVPYEGVASPKPLIPENRLLAFGTPVAKQGDVWHTQFFGQLETQQLLMRLLT